MLRLQTLSGTQTSFLLNFNPHLLLFDANTHVFHTAVCGHASSAMLHGGPMSPSVKPKHTALAGALVVRSAPDTNGEGQHQSPSSRAVARTAAAV